MGEFNKNGRRTELIRGIVIEKVRKTPLHCYIGKRLYDLALELSPKGFVVFGQDPLTFSDSEPEPDVAIVRGREDEFSQEHPSTAELVIEVADSSVALDLENASLYAEANVTEYWIVLAEARQVEVYRNPVNGRYQTKLLLGAGDQIECVGVEGMRIAISDIFSATE